MIKLYLILVVFLLLFSTCSDSNTGLDHDTVKEGFPTRFSLSIAVENNNQLTRALSPENVETRINNLFILIFNNKGQVLYRHWFAEREIMNNNISIRTISGPNRRIYAVANIDLGMMDTSLLELESISNETDLLELNSKLLQYSLGRGSSFIMSGSVVDSDGQTVNLSIPSTPSNISIGAITLKRLDAKIMFNVQTADGVVFTPRDWRVVQVPKNVPLFSKNTSDQFVRKDQYFTSSWANFEGEGDNLGKIFSFYILENKKSPKKVIPINDFGRILSSSQRYFYREKQEKVPLVEIGHPGQTVQNADFIYANENATYVQIRGHVKYNIGNNQEISADVTYNIHLGYVDHDPNDYNILRNSHYKYTVFIQSVNSILLEVQNNIENQPGVAGDVTIASQIYNFDAHYESLCISFHQSIIDNTLTWSVKTPFSSGVREEHPKDYNWILFRINRKNSAGTQYLDEQSPYLGDSKKFLGKITLDQYLNNPNFLLNVDQLITVLKESKLRYVEKVTNHSRNLFDFQDKITFTAFINENYYTINPIDGTTPIDLWKKFVNQPERVLNILSLNRYSNDGASMKSTAVYSFRQASIQTMYNVNHRETQTAWGSEMIQDMNEYSFYNKPSQIGLNSAIPTYNSFADGRGNTLKMWGVLASRKMWSTYLNTADGMIKSEFRYAKYMALPKNRDNNGNGIIDKEEVKWYLASINQLTDLWVGENSFDLQARLFKGTTWDEQWFVSSTVQERYQEGGSGSSKSYYDNPVVLWASEGSSIGLMTNASTTKLYYRCVRNLGVPDASDAVPEDFAIYNSTTRILSLPKLNHKSIRSYTQIAELPEHHERQADNLPWWNFQVYKGTFGQNYNWIEIRDLINSGNSPCPRGWRVPNQRELALMLSRVGNDGAWNLPYHMSRTRFQFNPLGGYRHGFSVTNKSGILFLINNRNERGGVRCVRDVQ